MSYYPTGNVVINTGGTCASQYTYNPYTTSGFGNLNWTVPSGGLTYASTGAAVTTLTSDLKLNKDADIKFGDVSLMETLREIQSQLGILTPDPELEAEFEELRACAEEYQRLRQKFLEQKRVWDTLKRQNI